MWKLIDQIEKIQDVHVIHVAPMNTLNAVYYDLTELKTGSIVIDLKEKKIKQMSEGLNNYQEIRNNIENALRIN